ncbi:13453_t:CDS:2 [Ambispora gerdemannii]|uniref:13453_t:CDS:1 n=1 Tax=Ambispora gerdemannii TaxID=144530 RepID=A0A9N8VIK9_9GLOM|nr:13453_t:CDS:2 [Ambispora gerdemannii]
MDLMTVIKERFNDTATSDLTLRVDNEFYYVHRCILQWASGYFRDKLATPIGAHQFQNFTPRKDSLKNWKDYGNPHILNISGNNNKQVVSFATTTTSNPKNRINKTLELYYTSTQFSEFLRFIYGYPLKDNNNYKSQDLFAIAYLAHKFQVKELKISCDLLLVNDKVWCKEDEKGDGWQTVLDLCKWLGLEATRKGLLDWIVHNWPQDMMKSRLWLSKLDEDNSDLHYILAGVLAVKKKESLQKLSGGNSHNNRVNETMSINCDEITAGRIISETNGNAELDINSLDFNWKINNCGDGKNSNNSDKLMTTSHATMTNFFTGTAGDSGIKTNGNFNDSFVSFNRPSTAIYNNLEFSPSSSTPLSSKDFNFDCSSSTTSLSSNTHYKNNNVMGVDTSNSDSNFIKWLESSIVADHSEQTVDTNYDGLDNWNFFDFSQELTQMQDNSTSLMQLGEAQQQQSLPSNILQVYSQVQSQLNPQQGKEHEFELTALRSPINHKVSIHQSPAFQQQLLLQAASYQQQNSSPSQKALTYHNSGISSSSSLIIPQRQPLTSSNVMLSSKLEDGEYSSKNVNNNTQNEPLSSSSTLSVPPKKKSRLERSRDEFFEEDIKL